MSATQTGWLLRFYRELFPYQQLNFKNESYKFKYTFTFCKMMMMKKSCFLFTTSIVHPGYKTSLLNKHRLQFSAVLAHPQVLWNLLGLAAVHFWLMWSLKIRSFQSVKHDTGVETLGPIWGSFLGLKIVPIKIGPFFLDFLNLSLHFKPSL